MAHCSLMPPRRASSWMRDKSDETAPHHAVRDKTSALGGAITREPGSVKGGTPVIAFITDPENRWGAAMGQQRGRHCKFGPSGRGRWLQGASAVPHHHWECPVSRLPGEGNQGLLRPLLSCRAKGIYIYDSTIAESNQDHEEHSKRWAKALVPRRSRGLGGGHGLLCRSSPRRDH